MKLFLSLILALGLNSFVFAMTGGSDEDPSPSTSSSVVYGGICEGVTDASDYYCDTVSSSYAACEFHEECRWRSYAPDNAGRCRGKNPFNDSHCEYADSKNYCQIQDECRWIPAR